MSAKLIQPKKLDSSQRVLVLDDNDDFRDSTVWLLEGMGYEVEAFHDPHGVIACIADSQVARESICLLLDVCMPSMNGLDVHKLMHERALSLPVIYMTAHADVSIVVAAMAEGAVTVLEKPLNIDALTKALKLALSDAMQLSRHACGHSSESRETRNRLVTLTPREGQILSMILTDKTNQAMSSELHISIKTVELYRSRMMSKLKARNAAHLVRLVMACGRY